MGTVDRGLEPHLGITDGPRARILGRTLTVATLCWCCAVSLPAAAEDAPRLRPVADLDGVYLTLGPTGGAVYTQEGWDSGFGGEISLVRVREQDVLGALGLGLGGIRFTTEDQGRIWADVQLGSRRPLGLGAGVSAGVTAEIDAVISPRWGAQATLWVFLGVIPYVRVGTVQRSGLYVDLGVKIALPVFRL